MKSKDYLNMLMGKIKNKTPLKLDLLNGIILDLKYEEKIKAYRGNWNNIEVGIWEIKTLLKIATNEINNVELV